MFSRGNPWERSSSAYGQHYGHRPASTNSGLQQLQYGIRPGGSDGSMVASALPHSRAPATPSIFTRNANTRSDAATQGDALMRAKVMRQVNPSRTAPLTAPSLGSRLGGLGGSLGGGGGTNGGGSHVGGSYMSDSFTGGSRHVGGLDRGALIGRRANGPMHAPAEHLRAGPQSGGVGRLSMPPSRLGHPPALGRDAPVSVPPPR